ncbi:non-homologous end-joining DNA ligase [Streptomyces sp. NPDC007107]|uniref:non-homologous end-joining DNA ligase n=1 Tax=Streptomyces sp. NPDC007107 TaxID=3156915 RepID=UPI0033D01990
MSAEENIRVGRRTVALTRPGKVLFPDDGITKAGLAEYYRCVASAMLPHLRGRPLMMERCPEGIDGPAFMQKEVPAHFPDWFHRVELPKEGGTVTYAVCDEAASLVYLAGQACITPHRFLSRADRPDRPDRMVFDLDPSGDDFGTVRTAALRLRTLLDELELPAAVMTTGSRGLHVVVPLDRRAPFDEVRDLAHRISGLLAARHPETLTTAPRKQARGGRLYLDVQRNAYAQTAVAPYAVRARPGAPVAAPLTWAEVEDARIHARSFTTVSVLDRLGDDPWRNAFRHPRAARAALRRLESLESGHRQEDHARTP